MPEFEQIRSRLERIEQAHLLRFYHDLDEAGRRRLLERIDALDLEQIPSLVERFVQDKPAPPDDGAIDPAPYYPRDPGSPKRAWDRDRFQKAGEDLVAAGKVAAFTVAGGQGTRLGYDGPKGCFPGSAVTGKPLFRCLAEWILAARRRYGAAIPWYVMTSPLNHGQTEAFFREHDWFGLGRENVMLFQQGVMPSFDIETGRILLAAPDAPATNPDGHGGSLKALHKSGAIRDMRDRGVEHISYTQVDNPLVRVIDPVFLGLHAEAEDSSGEMSSKMLAKTDPAEKVGVFCVRDGRLGMIEYSNLPEDLAAKRDEHGDLVFNAGNPAIHVLGVGFVERLNGGEEGFALPLQRAEKKVPHVDLETGERVEPESPNGIKLETFVFDALPLARAPIVLETDRIEEFAPIKNAEGKDSPDSSAVIQTQRAARWLRAGGVEVPQREDGTPDCVLEISPLAALEPADLKKADLPDRIDPGARFSL